MPSSKDSSFATDEETNAMAALITIPIFSWPPQIISRAVAIRFYFIDFLACSP